MSIILEDATVKKISQFKELRNSKIASAKRHLQNLVAKRLRLDTEIYNLTQSIRKSAKPKPQKAILKESALGDEDVSDVVLDMIAKDPESVALAEETNKFLEEVGIILHASANQFRSLNNQ